MANILEPMDIKQIFSLNIDNLSNRKIAVVLGISRNTVNQYISWLNASDYGPDEILSLSDGKPREIFPSRTTIKNERLISDHLIFPTPNQIIIHQICRNK